MRVGAQKLSNNNTRRQAVIKDPRSLINEEKDGESWVKATGSSRVINFMNLRFSDTKALQHRCISYVFTCE